MTFSYMFIYTLNVFNPPVILLPRLLPVPFLIPNSSLPTFTLIFLFHIHDKHICLDEFGCCPFHKYDL